MLGAAGLLIIMGTLMAYTGPRKVATSSTKTKSKTKKKNTPRKSKQTYDEVRNDDEQESSVAQNELRKAPYDEILV